MRSLVVAFIGFMTCASAFGQAAGDYRSAVVTGTWNTNTTWETFNGTSWVGATFAPAVGDGVITVQSGHTITMSSGELIDQVVVAGTLRINTNVTCAFSNVNQDVLTVNSGGTLDMMGTNSLITFQPNAKLRVNGTLIGRQSSSATFSGNTTSNLLFGAGSTYQHLFTSSAGTIPIASWNATSTLLIQGNVAVATAPTNLNQNFGNVTYNVSSTSPTLLLAGAFTNIQGNFSTLSTHARPFQLANVSGYSFTVGGDVSIGGSGAITFNAFTSGTSTWTINGSYSQSGASTITLVPGGTANINMTIGRNFTRSNGSLLKSGSGTATMTFNQTNPLNLPQVFTQSGAGTPFTAINFVVATGSTLDITGNSAVSGAGSFTVNNGATVVVGSTDASGAISSSGGNIRVSGTKTFSSGSTVRYHNATNSPQFLATDHPGGSGVTTEIDNSGGVTLVAGTYTLNGTLILTNGNFNISGRNLTLGGTLTAGSNFLVGDVSTILRISDGGTTADFNNLRVSGTSVIGSLILNGSTGRTVRLGANITVANDVTLQNGDLRLNGFGLDIGGAINQVSGTLTADAAGSLTISDLSPASLPADLIISGGALGTFTMSRAASEFITSSNLTLNTINLVTGTLTSLGTFTMAANGKFNVASGILTNPVIATTVYDVEYNGVDETDTGAELPVAGTILRHLIVSNPAQVNLKTTTEVNGDLILTAGILYADTVDITLRGNIQADGFANFIDGTTTFDGTTTITGSVAPQFGNAIINASQSLAVTGTLQMNVAGDFTNDGTFTANQSVVSLNGVWTNQVVSGATPTTFYGLEINKPADDLLVQHTVTIQQPIQVQDVLRVLTATQVAAGNDQLTIVSNATRTARVNPLITGAAINGRVIVQRYLPTGVPGQRYRYMSVPVINTNVADWQQEFSITGSFSDPSSGGTLIPTQPSMYWYDETFTAGGPALASRYRAYPTTGTAASNPLVSGRGYSAYTYTTVPITVETRGTLGQQQVVVNVTAQSAGGVDGWNLIGNPYPSPVSWDLISRSGSVDDAVYIPDNTNLSGQGAGFITYSSGVGVPDEFDGNIDMAQGFWVHATAAGTVTFDEDDKVVSTAIIPQIYRQAKPSDVLRISLKGATVKDELAIRFLDGADDKYDKKYDALKMFGTFNLTSLSSDGREMTINTVSDMGCYKQVPLSISGATAGSYTFTATNFDSFGTDVDIKLVDKKTSSTIDLRKTNTYTFSVAAADLAGLTSRFVVETGRTRLLTDLAVNGGPICFSDLNAGITIANTQPEVDYQVFYGLSAVSSLVKGNSGNLNIQVSAKTLEVGESSFSVAIKNGCASATLAGQAIVKKLGLTPAPVANNALACASDKSILTATGAVQGQSYTWYKTEDAGQPLSTTTNGSYEASGITGNTSYYVAIKDASGCESERVKLNVKSVDYEPVQIEQDGTTLTSSYFSGNQWYFDGTPVQGQTGQSIDANESGTYTVKVNIEGCIAEASIVQEITGLEPEATGINIFPNPVSTTFNIELPTGTAGTPAFTIVSTSGKVVYSGSFGSSGALSVDISGFAAGVYIVRIEIDGQIISKRIIKI